MSKAQLEKLWASSVEADSFDAFLSHTWWTPGYQKYISLSPGKLIWELEANLFFCVYARHVRLKLVPPGACRLLHFCWHYALAAMMLSSLVILMLYGWDMLPMPVPYPVNFVQFKRQIPSGPWSLLLSFVAALLTLAFAPDLPSCRTYKCFYDVACIHQSDSWLQAAPGIAMLNRGKRIH